MKKLLAMVAAFAMASALCGAQCEGKTQKGERCKRDAAEGSTFCIGHADQAKKPEVKKDMAAKPEVKKATATKPEAKKPTAGDKNAEAKERDDGTCWAVTEAGVRCKLKKDGDKDYCKIHSADTKPAKPFDQCRAMTYSGTQCTRKPEDGKRYCKQHLGK